MKMTYCKVCAGPVQMMSRKGTDLCCLDCERKAGEGKYAAGELEKREQRH